MLLVFPQRDLRYASERGEKVHLPDEYRAGYLKVFLNKPDTPHCYKVSIAASEPMAGRKRGLKWSGAME